MPDHAHEGTCIDTGSVPLGGTFDFGILPEVIEDTVLVHFVEATMKPALAVKAAASRGGGNAGTPAPALQIAPPDDLFLQGLDKRLDGVAKELSQDFEEAAKFAAALRR